MVVLFNTAHTIDSDTGWKAVSGEPSKTVWVMGGRDMVWELRLSRIVEILFTKKSQNLCGSSADGIEDGRYEVFDLPRRVFVMLNNCLDEMHARILVLKNLHFACCMTLLMSLQAERKIYLCTSRLDINHCISTRLLWRFALRRWGPTAQNQG